MTAQERREIGQVIKEIRELTATLGKKILTYRDGRRLIGWRSPLAKKWPSDGYEVLEEISRVSANEDAPIYLNLELSPSVYFRHVDGSETCLRIDPEGNFTAWRTQIVEPSADATANGSRSNTKL